MQGRWNFCLVLLFLLVACGEGVKNPVVQPPDPPAPSEPPPKPQEPPVVEPPVEPPAPEPQALTTYYLSDVLETSGSSGHGPFERDMSNGAEKSGDGQTLTINGKTYSKGLGVASPSELVFELGGVCAQFSAEVGVDDLWNMPEGSVTFEVYADGEKLWESGLMTVADPFKETDKLTIADKQQLKLVVTDGGNGGKDDYADWANAAIVCDEGLPALVDANIAVEGMFGKLEPWPLVATHAALLPDSTILSWYSRDTNGATRLADYNDQAKHNSSLVDRWDIGSTQHSNHDNMTTDLFCAGFAPTFDGNLFVAGGNLGERDGFYPGSRHTNLFNVETGLWSFGPEMTEGRWYPTVVGLPNKEMLIMGGSSNETTTYNHIPDVWNPETNTLRRLTKASTQNRNVHPLYPWLHVAPNGRVFYTGASTDMAYLGTEGQGSWGRTYPRDSLHRGYGTSVMYEPGKILVMGGGGNTKSAVTIDLTSGVTVTSTQPMNFGRTSLNATLLADGSVFVNGGNTSGTNFDDTTSVYESEIWNPETGQWQLGAQAQKPRNYHAVSLLLPDGRVWTAGGGGCGSCSVNQQTAEIYSPPYLFKQDGSGLLAERPLLTDVPSALTYEETFTLTSPGASTIQKVALVGMGSVTHAFNMNQRYVPLTIVSQDDSSLTFSAPDNANLAPPGYYLLFVIDSEGVPSYGKIVQVQ
jgi:NPCBM/NEW2 domain/Domain of unknown function (DUF1929)/Glyoxal oxidase N-terminus